MIERIACNRARSLLILTALFLLSIPTLAQIDNCCFVDRLCMSNAEWVNGYWAFQNKECAAPSQQQQSSSLQSQPQPAASSEIDNCCFVDWQCASDDDWVTGYWAYQNNQCAAPTDSPPQAQPRGTASEEVNNCCFTGWQCDADDEWRSGYWAFQHDQCEAPAQWQGQWQQMKQQQQQRNNDNQQGQNGNRRPNSGNQQQQGQNGNQGQSEKVEFVLDVSDYGIQEQENEGGPTVTAQNITHEKMCSLFPWLYWCAEMFPDLYG